MEDLKPIKTDFVHESKKLFVVFGGIAAGIGMPPFEFVKSLNIVSESRVFVRDLRKNWYQSGLPGISNNIEGTKEYLESVIREQSPSEVVMVGNSMGGYAAIMFSALIGNSRAVAFAPQTFISPLKRLRHRDYRWINQILDTYKHSWNKRAIWDLQKLNYEGNWRADLHVCNRNRLDYLHAMNLSKLPQVTIHEYEFGGHALVKKLRDSGELASILK